MRAIPKYEAPPDVGGMYPDGRLLLIECKQVTSGKCLAVERERPRNKGEKRNGLHFHQGQNLMDTMESGGASLLLVEFSLTHSVYALDGLALRQWWDGGDEADAGKARMRKSISLKHFKEWGAFLGAPDLWEFAPGFLTRLLRERK